MVYDLSSREIFISRDVEFYELVFPYTGSESRSLDWKCIEVPLPLNTLQPHCDFPPSPNLIDSTINTPSLDPAPLPDPAPLSYIPETSPSSSNRNILTKKSDRPKHKPAYLTDYHCSQLTTSTAHPIEKYLTYSNLSSSHKAYAISLATDQEPASFQEASKHDC